MTKLLEFERGGKISHDSNFEGNKPSKVDNWVHSFICSCIHPLNNDSVPHCLLSIYYASHCGFNKDKINLDLCACVPYIKAFFKMQK